MRVVKFEICDVQVIKTGKKQNFEVFAKLFKFFPKSIVASGNNLVFGTPRKISYCVFLVLILNARTWKF
jgi:hypothetical protein